MTSVMWQWMAILLTVMCVAALLHIRFYVGIAAIIVGAVWVFFNPQVHTALSQVAVVLR